MLRPTCHQRSGKTTGRYDGYQTMVEEKAKAAVREALDITDDSGWDTLKEDDKDAYRFQAQQAIGGEFSLKFERYLHSRTS